MDLQQRKISFVKIGKQLAKVACGEGSEAWNESIQRAKARNGWFTEENVLTAISAIAEMLKKEALDEWLSGYEISSDEPVKTVGVVMAGNIPLVGFHDLLCVLITGNKALVKCATLDAELPKMLVETMTEINPTLAERINITEGKFENLDAVIATGSDNSARYFEY